MKTSITDELELPEEVQEVARREALRSNREIGAVYREWLLDKARAIKGHRKPSHKTREVAA